MRRSFAVSLAFLSLLICTMWVFPAFWYRPSDTRGAGFIWLTEQSTISDWKFHEISVGKAAEAILVADKIFNGEFSRPDGTTIQAYGAKRYVEKENEIGLFSHTPDRCWTAAGWKMEPSNPSFVEREIHGLRVLLERRVFSAQGHRQLVYFGAVVGGRPLPYRIDQYMTAATKRSAEVGGDTAGTWERLRQPRLWGWAWESFINRTPLSGPQQFFRVSTPIVGNDIAPSERLLNEFLPLWLQLEDFQKERIAWSSAKGEAAKSQGSTGVASGAGRSHPATQ
jgi:hypothetical protein